MKIKECNIAMPSEGTKILEFNQYQKSVTAPFIIYADLDCIIQKTHGCKNNAENSSTIKVSKHIPSGFSVSTISSIRSIENNRDVYRGKHCVKTEHAMKMINFKQKKNKLLTKEQQELFENSKICYTCREKFGSKYLKDKKYCKVRDHCHYTGEYRGDTHSICNLKYSAPKKIVQFFLMGQTMIIILSYQLAEDF